MLNCMNIGVLLVYAFILFKVLKKEQKMEMFILTGVAFFLLNNTEGFTDADVTSDSSTSSNLAQDGSTDSVFVVNAFNSS